jgi:predicted CoA-binding protein
MEITEHTLYYVSLADVEHPVLCWAVFRPRPHVVELAINAYLDHSIVLHWTKWEEDTQSVSLTTEEHGAVVISKIDEQLLEKLKQDNPVLSGMSLSRLKNDGLQGYRG